MGVRPQSAQNHLPVEEQFQLVNPTSTNFVLQSDNDGGTTIAVCYCSGTSIRVVCREAMDELDILVEHLKVGDYAVTATGRRRLITWIGHRAIDCRHHPRPHEVRPVRIAAGAFGQSRPTRDLYVSPGHSICVDLLGEMLIPAGALVNGTTIRQENVDSVTYWHVELDSHDVILAENLRAESYLEMGNRGFFADGSVVALGAGPDAPMRTHADFCRPFVADGPMVEAVKARLQERAIKFACSLAGSSRDRTQPPRSERRSAMAGIMAARSPDSRSSPPAPCKW